MDFHVIWMLGLGVGLEVLGVVGSAVRRGLARGLSNLCYAFLYISRYFSRKFPVVSVQISNTQ